LLCFFFSFLHNTRKHVWRRIWLFCIFVDRQICGTKGSGNTEGWRTVPNPVKERMETVYEKCLVNVRWHPTCTDRQVAWSILPGKFLKSSGTGSLFVCIHSKEFLHVCLATSTKAREMKNQGTCQDLRKRLPWAMVCAAGTPVVSHTGSAATSRSASSCIHRLFRCNNSVSFMVDQVLPSGNPNSVGVRPRVTGSKLSCTPSSKKREISISIGFSYCLAVLLVICNIQSRTR